MKKHLFVVVIGFIFSSVVMANNSVAPYYSYLPQAKGSIALGSNAAPLTGEAYIQLPFPEYKNTDSIGVVTFSEFINDYGERFSGTGDYDTYYTYYRYPDIYYRTFQPSISWTLIKPNMSQPGTYTFQLRDDGKGHSSGIQRDELKDATVTANGKLKLVEAQITLSGGVQRTGYDGDSVYVVSNKSTNFTATISLNPTPTGTVTYYWTTDPNLYFIFDSQATTLVRALIAPSNRTKIVGTATVPGLSWAPSVYPMQVRGCSQDVLIADTKIYLYSSTGASSSLGGHSWWGVSANCVNFIKAQKTTPPGVPERDPRNIFIDNLFNSRTIGFFMKDIQFPYIGEATIKIPDPHTNDADAVGRYRTVDFYSFVSMIDFSFQKFQTPGTYNLGFNNCTHVAVQAAGIAGWPSIGSILGVMTPSGLKSYLEVTTSY